MNVKQNLPVGHGSQPSATGHFHSVNKHVNNVAANVKSGEFVGN